MVSKDKFNFPKFDKSKAFDFSKMEMPKIDFDKIKGQEELPKLVKTWTETFGQVSRYNEFPAILAYFTMLGQLTKDFIRIPYGFTIEDTRIHVCWIQTARSGKSVLNDFIVSITSLTVFVSLDPLNGV